MLRRMEVQWLLVRGLLMCAAMAECAGGQHVGLCGARASSRTLLQPGKDGCRVRAFGAECASDSELRVTFREPGGGVGIRPADGAWDASACVAVAVDIRNVGAEPVTLLGSLGDSKWVNSFLHVPAGETCTMLIHVLRKEVPDQRKDMFTGMRGLPGGHLSHWTEFDAARVRELLIRDLDGVSVGQSVQIAGVRGVGRYAPLPAEAEQAFFPFVDAFGQFKHASWPGKITARSDLAAARRREEEDRQRHPGPGDRSRYGGWLGGPKLAATGHFRTEKRDGMWWLVDPEGCLFWSHGVTGVHFRAGTRVHEREHYFERIPASFHERGHVDFAKANLSVKYGEQWETEASEAAHQRLRSWGMNTIANWSDPAICELRKTPYVVAIHYAGWGSDTLEGLLRSPQKLRELLHKRLLAEKGRSAEDPWCIGYFVDNEIKWRGKMDADLYYRTVREEVRKVAPHKLYLGSRLHGHDQPYGNKRHIVAAAVRYCDVLSVNRYRFSPSDLRMLEGVDVPLIIGEFHFGALDRGMLHTGLRGVANQRQRGYAYEHYLAQALKHPHIVGAHWFQYREQSVTGRGDGENYQIGFVDICDTPYRETVEAARRIGACMYELRAAEAGSRSGR